MPPLRQEAGRGLLLQADVMRDGVNLFLASSTNGFLPCTLWRGLARACAGRRGLSHESLLEQERGIALADAFDVGNDIYRVSALLKPKAIPLVERRRDDDCPWVFARTCGARASERVAVLLQFEAEKAGCLFNRYRFLNRCKIYLLHGFLPKKTAALRRPRGFSRAVSWKRSQELLNIISQLRISKTNDGISESAFGLSREFLEYSDYI